MVTVTLEMSPEAYNNLNTIADSLGVTPSEAWRKALALLTAATEARNEGNRIAVVNHNGDIIYNIVGLAK